WPGGLWAIVARPHHPDPRAVRGPADPHRGGGRGGPDPGGAAGARGVGWRRARDPREGRGRRLPVGGMTLPRSATAFDRDALAQADSWGAGRWGVAVLDRDALVAERGSRDVALPWASVTKLATAWTSLIAVDRGVVG